MDKKSKKEKLIKQILKFGVVGGLAFLIDFVVYTIVLSVLDWEYGYLVAGFAGFTVSLIFNYLASMAFVFERKENADKRKEFVVFLLLSLVGMGINTLVLWVCEMGLVLCIFVCGALSSHRKTLAGLLKLYAFSSVP